MIRDFHELKTALSGKSSLRVVVIGTREKPVLEAIKEATLEGWVNPILISLTEQTEDIDIPRKKSFYEPDPKKAAAIGVDLIKRGEADLIMKGDVQTAELLHPVVAKENGLVTDGRILSHVAIFLLPGPKRFTLLSDAAVIIEPDLEAKAKLIDNAVEVARKLGYDPPKVAVLSAIEKVNPKIPSSVDASLLKEQGKVGRFGNALISGPLALDNAICQEAVLTKHLGDDPVAGQADILITPELISANILYKSFSLVSGYLCGGVVVGARIPLILTSRADSPVTKVNSIALACYLKHFG